MPTYRSKRRQIRPARYEKDRHRIDSFQTQSLGTMSGTSVMKSRHTEELGSIQFPQISADYLTKR